MFFLTYPDYGVSRGKAQHVTGDGGLRRFPGQSGALDLDVGGRQVTRRVHVCRGRVRLNAAVSGAAGVKGAPAACTPTCGELCHCRGALLSSFYTVDSNRVGGSWKQRVHLELHRVPRNMLDHRRNCGESNRVIITRSPSPSLFYLI